MRVGGRLFAVYADEVEATAENLTPTPLPFAPPAVRGVVSLRGRVRTVLDPLHLAPSTNDTAPPTAPRLFVALKGDEQLALACDSAEGSIEITPAQIQPPPGANTPVRGTIDQAGSDVTLLDCASLFDIAMRGTDRRRRRS